MCQENIRTILAARGALREFQASIRNRARCTIEQPGHFRISIYTAESDQEGRCPLLDEATELDNLAPRIQAELTLHAQPYSKQLLRTWYELLTSVAYAFGLTLTGEHQTLDFPRQIHSLQPQITHSFVQTSSTNSPPHS